MLATIFLKISSVIMSIILTFGTFLGFFAPATTEEASYYYDGNIKNVIYMIGDGMGIYYNMETYRNDKYCDDSCISVSDELTRDELEKVTEKLLISNHWNPIYNCVFFACSIWNTAGDTFILPFFYPPVTRLMISIAGDGEKCEMVHQPGENSFKQRGFGSNSYLENVCQKSLDA